jgi:succinate dehydrogenase / fumarate reductase flavoprotein subunit
MSNLPGCTSSAKPIFGPRGQTGLGASALMQGLADGYFVLPYTIGHYFASVKRDPVTTDHPRI